MSQLERDLNSASIRRDVVAKELKDTQQEMSNLQAAKRKLEAQIDEQKQQLQSLNIEVKTLKAEKEAQSSSMSGVYRRNEDSQRGSWRDDSQRNSYRGKSDDDSQRSSWREEPQRGSNRRRNDEDSQRTSYRNDANTMVVYSRQPELPRRDEPQVTVSCLCCDSNH